MTEFSQGFNACRRNIYFTASLHSLAAMLIFIQTVSRELSGSTPAPTPGAPPQTKYIFHANLEPGWKTRPVTRNSNVSCWNHPGIRRNSCTLSQAPEESFKLDTANEEALTSLYPFENIDLKAWLKRASWLNACVGAEGFFLNQDQAN